MSGEDDEAAELEHAEEVGFLMFPAADESAEVVEPCEEALVLRLEESYRLWQRRDLAEEKILYLYLDAIYPKVRSAGRVVSLAVLVALGVKDMEAAALMLGTDKSRGYCLEMICADFLAGASLEVGDEDKLLFALTRLIGSLAREQKCQLLEIVRNSVEGIREKAAAASA